MPLPSHWIEHRRGDKELIGWIVPEGEHFATVDLLGRRCEPVDWLTAEERLDELGIGYLADPFAYWKSPGTWVRVRLLEVSPHGITVQEGIYDDPSGEELPQHRLTWPIPDELVPWSEVQLPSNTWGT